MLLKVLLIIYTIDCLFFGCLFLMFPGKMLSAYGHDIITPGHLFTGRAHGSLMMAIGVMGAVFLSKKRTMDNLKPLIYGSMVGCVLFGSVSLHALLNETLNNLLIASISFCCFFVIAFTYVLVRNHYREDLDEEE